jgi:hypothetical protein
MLSKRAGIIIAIIAAAVLTALIIYGLGITGEEAPGLTGTP